MSKISLNTAFSALTKLNDWWVMVKDNFLSIVTGHNALEDRVDNIVASSGTSNTEIVDARHSVTKNKTFTVLTDRLEETETEVTMHLADDVTDTDGAHGLKIETGTWTPTISSNTGTSAHTYSAQFGRYFKIGKKVFLEFFVALSAKDAGMTGTIVYVGGCPFVPDADLRYSNPISINASGITNVTGVNVFIRTSSRIQLSRTSNTGVESAVGASLINAATSIRGQISFNVA